MTVSDDAPDRAERQSAERPTRDFSISYAAEDQPWAECMAWQLEEAGYSTILQAWDFRPGSNFPLQMDIAVRGTRRTVAVLSPRYVESLYSRPEWAAAFSQNPTGERRTLVPVRVAHVEMRGLLRSIVYIDLVKLDEVAAREALLLGVAPGELRPTVAPPFPATGPTWTTKRTNVGRTHAIPGL